MRDQNFIDQLLRHHLDEKGVHPDPKKVEDIKMLPTPESKTELQEFLSSRVFADIGSTVHEVKMKIPRKPWM